MMHYQIHIIVPVRSDTSRTDLRQMHSRYATALSIRHSSGDITRAKMTIQSTIFKKAREEFNGGLFTRMPVR